MNLLYKPNKQTVLPDQSPTRIKVHRQGSAVKSETQQKSNERKKKQTYYRYRAIDEDMKWKYVNEIT